MFKMFDNPESTLKKTKAMIFIDNNAQACDEDFSDFDLTANYSSHQLGILGTSNCIYKAIYLTLHDKSGNITILKTDMYSLWQSFLKRACTLKNIVVT